jgi:hypothetical protein
MGSMNEAARRIADKYIARDGSTPKPEVETARADKAADIAAVAAFIAWHDDHEVYGGRYAHEVWAAFCRLLNTDPRILHAHMRG